MKSPFRWWVGVVGVGASLVSLSCGSGASCESGHVVLEGAVSEEFPLAKKNSSFFQLLTDGGQVHRNFEGGGHLRIEYGKPENPPKGVGPVAFRAPIVKGELELPSEQGKPRAITGGTLDYDENGPDKATFDIAQGTIESCF